MALDDLQHSDPNATQPEPGKQTQTQSQQQPPVKQPQESVEQPQVRGGKSAPAPADDPGIPPAAQLPPLTEAKYVPLPAGGLRALAIQLFPDDRDNPDALNAHVADLLMMNRDVVRDEWSSTVGTSVRIA